MKLQSPESHEIPFAENAYPKAIFARYWKGGHVYCLRLGYFASRPRANACALLLASALKIELLGVLEGRFSGQWRHNAFIADSFDELGFGRMSRDHKRATKTTFNLLKKLVAQK